MDTFIKLVLLVTCLLLLLYTRWLDYRIGRLEDHPAPYTKEPEREFQEP